MGSAFDHFCFTEGVLTMTESGAPIPVDLDIASWFASLDEDTQELFNERAGIREHDGNMSRQNAERAAMGDVMNRHIQTP